MGVWKACSAGEREEEWRRNKSTADRRLCIRGTFPNECLPFPEDRRGEERLARLHRECVVPH